MNSPILKEQKNQNNNFQSSYFQYENSTRLKNKRGCIDVSSAFCANLVPNTSGAILIKKSEQPQLAPFNVEEQLFSFGCPNVGWYIKWPFDQSGSDRRIQYPVLNFNGGPFALRTAPLILQESQENCSSFLGSALLQMFKCAQQILSVFISKRAYNTMCGYIFSTVFPTGMGTLSHGSIGDMVNQYRNMDGDGEISIGILSVCSS